VKVSGESPVLIDQYLRDAIECDVDALRDGDDVVVAGCDAAHRGSGHPFGRQRLHPAALHRCAAEIIAELERQAVALAKALSVKGLMNIQFAVKDGLVYLIEVNPRASAHGAVRGQGDRPAGRQVLPRGSWRARS
jgi:carbamoyl-phosphate synthase large subunit